MSDVAGAGVGQGGDEAVCRGVGHDGLDGVAASGVELVHGGRLQRWDDVDDLVEVGAAHVELHKDLAPRLQGAVQQREELTHGVGLVGVGVAGRVGEQLDVAGADSVDDLEAGGAHGPPRSGEPTADLKSLTPTSYALSTPQPP